MHTHLNPTAISTHPQQHCRSGCTASYGQKREFVFTCMCCNKGRGQPFNEKRHPSACPPAAAAMSACRKHTPCYALYPVLAAGTRKAARGPLTMF